VRALRCRCVHMHRGGETRGGETRGVSLSPYICQARGKDARRERPWWWSWWGGQVIALVPLQPAGNCEQSSGGRNDGFIAFVHERSRGSPPVHVPPSRNATLIPSPLS
jgi:hypothetical protein